MSSSTLTHHTTDIRHIRNMDDMDAGRHRYDRWFVVEKDKATHGILGASRKGILVILFPVVTVVFSQLLGRLGIGSGCTVHGARAVAARPLRSGGARRTGRPSVVPHTMLSSPTYSNSGRRDSRR